MFMKIVQNSLLLAAACIAVAKPAIAQNPETPASEAQSAPQDPPAQADASCAPGGKCAVKLGGKQVVHQAETLVRAGEYEQAQPWLNMLAIAPEFFLEYHFLSGYAAKHQGKLAEAETHFRTILDRDPNQTRVRLELAEILFAKGDREAAAYHLKLVEQSSDIPEDVRGTVRSARSAIRDQRAWRFSFNFGIAPDTNINNATDNETVNVNLGFAEFEAALNDDARAKSGIGATADMSAGYRLALGETSSLLVEADAAITEYKGQLADDYQLKIAIGPEVRLSKNTVVALQGTAQQRWFAGDALARSFGAKLDVQQSLNRASALALSIDGEKQNFLQQNSYDAWNYGTALSYERGISKNFRLSVTGFARRNDASAKNNSYRSFGAAVGLGGELPYGFNIGASVTYIRSEYDAPTYIYSNAKRKDDRLSARTSLGNRSVKLLGFSPSVEYSYNRNDSNYSIYQSDRHRAEFKLARYF